MTHASRVKATASTRRIGLGLEFDILVVLPHILLTFAEPQANSKSLVTLFAHDGPRAMKDLAVNVREEIDIFANIASEFHLHPSFHQAKSPLRTCQ